MMFALLAGIIVAQANATPPDVSIEFLSALTQPLSLELQAEQALDRLAASYPDCGNPKPDDARPYTLCLSETDFERAEDDMPRAWTLTLARVIASEGAPGERRLKSQQKKWVAPRDRQCEDFAKDTPLSQVGRNHMDCMARATTERTAYLRRIADTVRLGTADAHGPPK